MPKLDPDTRLDVMAYPYATKEGVIRNGSGPLMDWLSLTTRGLRLARRIPNELIYAFQSDRNSYPPLIQSFSMRWSMLDSL